MRRELLLAAAFLPVAAVCSAAQPPSPATGAFRPPAAPMLLTRTLRHVLHDGAAVVSRRTYRVRFVPDGAGFRLDGTLFAVTVNAPAGLEPLAELERRRADAGMFPILLDAAGSITPAPALVPSEEQRRAGALAGAQIAQMDLAPADAAQAQDFVGRFRNRAFGTPWPPELFHPSPGARRDERVIPLPGGQAGRVVTETSAAADPTGLLTALERKVTTEAGGESRVVIERWTLSTEP